MIDILTRLKKSFDEVQINKFLYDDVSFFRRLDFWVLTFMGVTGGLVLWLTSGLENSHFYLVLYMLAIGFGGFLVVNRANKKRLFKKKIKYDKKPLRHWAGEGYQQKKLEKFYEILVERELLHNSISDIELLVEYEKLCESESNFFKSNQSYLFGGGILILFILPVWSEIIKILLSDTENFTESIKLIVSFVFSIGLIIYILSGIDKALIQFVNSTSLKYLHIAKLLRALRINLLIKNAKPKA